MTELIRRDLGELAFSPTAWLFEGGPTAGVGITIFVVRTPPGGGVDLHVHPYAETFVLIEGHGRWTAGDQVTELGPEQIYLADELRFTRDPFDALIVASARTLDLPLLTRDADIRASGTVRVIW